MKWLTLVLLNFYPPPYHELYDRYAIINVNHGESFGSAVSLGRGYFLTARHIIYGDSGFRKFAILSPRGLDSMAVIVKDTGDVVLLKSALDDSLSLVRISKPKLGKEVIFLQPIFKPGQVALFLHYGRVSLEGDDFVHIDRPLYPGVSGTGIFNTKEELVGIANRMSVYGEQIIMGVFTPSGFLKNLLREMK